MTDPNKLYESYIRKGSYFNLMLNCGHNYNQWVQNALCYLPQDILDEHKENLLFLTTADVDGRRIARHCPARHFRNNYFEFKVSPTMFSSL